MSEPRLAPDRMADVAAFFVVVALPLAFSPFSAWLFIDIKLVVLVAAAFLLVLARSTVDRSIATAALVWVAVLACATAFGRDPWWGLLGPEDQGMGLVALIACAALVVAATGFRHSLRERVPVWLFWTAAGVSAVAVVGRFVDIGGATWELGRLSSTIGHRVFVGGFVGAGIIAATQLRNGTWWRVAGLTLLGSGLAVSAARSAWIGVVIGLIYVVVRKQLRWRSVAVIVLPVVVALAGWTVASHWVQPSNGVPLSAAPRFSQLSEGETTARLPAWEVDLQASTHHPVLGAGPGTSWYDFLHNATAAQVANAERGFADAHDLFIEMLNTTGALGLLALVALFFIVVRRWRNAPPEWTWAGGACIALGTVSLLQPLNLVITPLLFLTAGLAASVAAPKGWTISRWLALPVGVALLLSSLRLASSTLEQFGSTYASETALRWSLRLEPRRFGATRLLARSRALDHRAGDRTAGPDARRLAARLVRDHAWYPNARLEAADVYSVLDDSDEAARLIRNDLAIFPNDPLAITGAAVIALRKGDRHAAQRLAQRAVSIDPTLVLPQDVLKSITNTRPDDR